MIIYLGFIIRRNSWNAFQTVPFKSPTTLERLFVKDKTNYLHVPVYKTHKHRYKKNTCLPLLLGGTSVLQLFSSSGIDHAP